MKKFLIGMHGKCDETKYKRDFKPGFYGVEACLLPDENEVTQLSELAKKDGFRLGCHYPLTVKNSAVRDPLLLSRCKATALTALESFEREACYAASLGFEYILTHFPKPVLVDEGFDLSFWRFADSREWMPAREYPESDLILDLYALFSELEAISNRYHIKVVLENDAICRFLAGGNLLDRLFCSFPSVKACLDIGRLHLQSRADPGFCGMQLARKLAPYTFILHLWNAAPKGNAAGGHFPVSPTQRPGDGYADIESYLRLVFGINPEVLVLFEHRSDLITETELEECYAWVDGIRASVTSALT